ncbi:ComEA family DNA-binding protein [Thalassolituus sp. LLYu03]|uniref:ComEA family DNA-binding protein n=1 Tax=Thalassolituus sp. LLYu03 TaxID=3421656 RepID=UPI003D29136A
MSAVPTAHDQPAVKELRLDGGCGYRIHDDRVVVNIGRILSDRDDANLSGTLSIELWALHQPYSGGGFRGMALAGTRIGELLGGHMLTNCEYDLIFQAPPAGLWHLCLMLREWNGCFFETVDYVNFAHIYREPAELHLVNGQAAGIGVGEVVNLESAPATISTPAQADGGKVALKKGQGKNKKPVAKVVHAEEPVSVNDASAKKLARIKGISDKLAEAIVSGRPYASLAELKKVKGIGDKLLEKIQTHICL